MRPGPLGGPGPGDVTARLYGSGMSAIDYSILDPRELEVIRYVLRKSAKGGPGVLRRQTIPLEDGFGGPYLRDVARLLPDYMVRDFKCRNQESITLPEGALPGPEWDFLQTQDWDDRETEFFSVAEDYDFQNGQIPFYSVSRPAIWWDGRASLIFVQWFGGLGGLQSDYILLHYNHTLERWYRLRRVVAGTS